jgi:beta-glucosidase/6-phospho-beta-glucosidase/beta-galactosidase
VAPQTFERRPKPSAYWFAEVARANALLADGVARD